MNTSNGYPKVIEMSLSADTIRSQIETWLRTTGIIHDSEDASIRFISNDPECLNNETTIPIQLKLSKYKPKKKLDLSIYTKPKEAVI